MTAFGMLIEHSSTLVRGPTKRCRLRPIRTPSTKRLTGSSTPIKASQHGLGLVWLPWPSRAVTEDAEALERTARPVQALRQRHLLAARSQPHRRGSRGRVLVQQQPPSGLRRTHRPRASPRLATARSASSSTDSRVAKGKPLPLIVRESDGGYAYGTTDSPRSVTVSGNSLWTASSTSSEHHSRCSWVAA